MANAVEDVAKHLYTKAHNTVTFDPMLLLLFVQAVAAIIRAYQECRGDKATPEATLEHLRNQKHIAHRFVLSLFWQRWIERVLARTFTAHQLEQLGGSGGFASLFVGELNRGKFDKAIEGALAGDR